MAGSLLLAAAARSDAAEPAPSAATIIERAAPPAGERVRFEEHRSNSLLSEPLVLQGYVSRSEDGTLERVVERPFAETATIDGTRATLERDGRRRTVSLARRGAGVAYLRSLYALLSGDVAALEAAFDPEVTGNREDWALTLVPRDGPAQRWLSRIVVAGGDDRVDRIRMERDDGAWQEMRLLRPAL